MIFKLLARVPAAQHICRRDKQLPSYVTPSQADFMRCADEPELVGTCFNERVPTTPSLINGDCHRIVTVKVDQLAC